DRRHATPTSRRPPTATTSDPCRLSGPRVAPAAGRVRWHTVAMEETEPTSRVEHLGVVEPGSFGERVRAAAREAELLTGRVEETEEELRRSLTFRLARIIG